MTATANKQLDAVLDRLDRVTQKGDGHEAECPCHDDGTNSLCIGAGDVWDDDEEIGNLFDFSRWNGNGSASSSGS